MENKKEIVDNYTEECLFKSININKTIIWLFGIDKDVYENEIPQVERRSFRNKLIVLVLAVLVSCITSFEVAYTLGARDKYLGLAMLCWAVLIFILDVLLIRKSFQKEFRLLASLSIAAVNVIFAVTFLMRDEVDNEIERVRFEEQINKIEQENDSILKNNLEIKQWRERLKANNSSIEDLQQQYDSEISGKDGRAPGKGPKATKFEMDMDKFKEENIGLENKIAEKEKNLLSNKKEQIKGIKQQKRGIFDRMGATILVLQKGGIKLYVAILIAMFILFLESVLIWSEFKNKTMVYDMIIDNASKKKYIKEKEKNNRLQEEEKALDIIEKMLELEAKIIKNRDL